jgi:hypothetical protein
MALRSKHRTHRTDANRNVLEQHQGLFELKWLSEAHRLGVPARFLEPGGWAGNEEDLTGFWAEAVYMLGEALAALDSDPVRCNRAIEMCKLICGNFGVSTDAIPFDARRFLRDFNAARDRREAIKRGDPLPLASEAEVCWGQW